MATAYSPTGSIITGTLDDCPCLAGIDEDSFKRLPDGSLDFEWSGDSDMFYDDQRTRQRDGKDIYLDEDGGEWTADQIRLEGEPTTDGQVTAQSSPWKSEEDSNYPLSDWRDEVAAGNTRRGYEDWVAAKREEATEDEEIPTTMG